MQKFIELLTERLNQYKHICGYEYFDRYAVVSKIGTKYTKILRQEITADKVVNEQIVCFVSNETGDIFKPATYQVPAKHARGNVNSEMSGMEAISPEGFVVYLRG